MTSELLAGFTVDAVHCNDDTADLDLYCEACRSQVQEWDGRGPSPTLAAVVAAAEAHILACSRRAPEMSALPTS